MTLRGYRRTGPPEWQRRLVLLLTGLFGATLLLFAVWAMLLWIERERVVDCEARGGQYDPDTAECEGARWD